MIVDEGLKCIVKSYPVGIISGINILANLWLAVSHDYKCCNMGTILNEPIRQLQFGTAVMLVAKCYCPLWFDNLPKDL